MLIAEVIMCHTKIQTNTLLCKKVLTCAAAQAIFTFYFLHCWFAGLNMT